MYVVVLILGVVAAVAGAAALVFGFSIKEFTFGSTLLITGTTSLVGGLIMIAVGGATRELNRIARALNRPPRFARPGDQFDPYAPGSFRPGAPRPPAMPIPPASMPPPAASTAPAQAAAPAAPKLETPAPHAAAKTEPTPPPAPATQQAASAAEAAEAEPASPAEREFAFYQRAERSLLPEDRAAADSAAELEESEAVPLSPDEVPRAPAFEALNQPPALSPERDAEEARRGPQDEPVDQEADVREPEPHPQPSGDRRRSPFDAIWPPREPPSTPQSADAEHADMGSHGDAAEIPTEEAASPATAPFADASWQPEDTVAQPQTAHSDEADTRAEPPHAVSILKSGVVDGMAYTLYSDGSIEAELPSGTIRFASINELRLHLEKTG